MKNSAGRRECYPPRPRWITPSEICRILHILRKPNSIIALLFIQNIFFAQDQTCKLYSPPFLFLLNDTTSCPGFLGQWFNLWRQWFNNLRRAALLTSLVQYDKILDQQQLWIIIHSRYFPVSNWLKPGAVIKQVSLEQGHLCQWIFLGRIHEGAGQGCEGSPEKTSCLRTLL